MRFVSDEQRKAAFARMKGGGRSSGPRTKKPPSVHPGLQGVIEWMLGSKPKNTWTPKAPGKGIPGTAAGAVVLTGGAIYSTPGSNWFISPEIEPVTPSFGQTPAFGIPPQETSIEIEVFEPPKTLAGSLYLLVTGVDPNSGNVQPPMGTPGTLKPYGPLMEQFVHERMASQYFPTAGQHKMFHGGTANIPSRYTGQASPSAWTLPPILQWWENLE